MTVSPEPLQYLTTVYPKFVLLAPKRQEIQVHPLHQQPTTLGIDDVLEGGELLPGFRLAVRDLFGEQE